MSKIVYDYLHKWWSGSGKSIKKDKYKWHDLRKNPADLPQFNTQVVVAFTGTPICDIAVYSNTTKLWGTITSSYSTGQVIAWKEIEPFERGIADE